MITRIAPTPSGFLHRGNLYNFLLTWLWARSNGGKILLRIDDADAARKRPAYVADIFRVLEQLQLDWDIGPASVADFEKNWSQQQRQQLYAAMLEELWQQQLAYACTCSRNTLAHSPLACTCAALGLPKEAAATCWRTQMEQAVVEVNDSQKGTLTVPINRFILRRREGLAAYQVSSLADDLFYQVTHVVRGEDLLPSTAMQLFLDAQLTKPAFHRTTFWHHPLLQDAAGRKLSKSVGAAIPAQPASVNLAELLPQFCHWMGWPIVASPRLRDLIGHPDLLLPER